MYIYTLTGTFFDFQNLNKCIHKPGLYAYIRFSFQFKRSYTTTTQMTKQIVFAVALALASTLALAAKLHKQAKSNLQVRNWSQIDTNHDNLISPDEMEKFLATHPGPQANKK